MAQQNLSAGAYLAPLRPDTTLNELSPGALQKMTPEERARALKRTKKGVPAQAALVTPTSILDR